MSSEHAPYVEPPYWDIGLLFGKRLNTILLRHRLRKYPDSTVHTLSHSLRIFVYFFFTLESGFKNINRPHVIAFVADFCIFFFTLHSGFKNIRIQPPTRYRIRCGFLYFFFSLWRADLKISGFAVEFAGCVWTGPKEKREK